MICLVIDKAGSVEANFPAKVFLTQQTCLFQGFLKVLPIGLLQCLMAQGSSVPIGEYSFPL